MMHRIPFTFLLVLAGSLMLFNPAHAEDAKAVTYGDWGYKCDKSPDGKQELCYVFQNVTKKEGGQLVLGARIAYREGQGDPLVVVTVFPFTTVIIPEEIADHLGWSRTNVKVRAHRARQKLRRLLEEEIAP